jgi:RNA polymerase sigma factor (sigma-70 family)
MNTSSEEIMTIQQAQKGDALAFARLHDRYYGDIFRYFFYRVADSTFAETLTANLFVRIVDRIGIYKPEKTPFLSWLYSLARSEMLEDLLERQQDYDRGLLLDNFEIETKNSPAKKLKHALAALSPDERDVIVGRIIEKRPAKEVAREIGRSVAGVRSLQNQALGKLLTASDSESAP